MAQEGVNEEYIWVNELSRVGGKGGLRTALTPLRDFALQEVISEADGFQAQLSFMLLRGSYATVLLREIIKPHDPIASGF